MRDIYPAKTRCDMTLLPRITLFIVAVTVVSATLAPALAQDRRPMEIEDVLALAFVADPRISPDGRFVAADPQPRVVHALAPARRTQNLGRTTVTARGTPLTPTLSPPGRGGSQVFLTAPGERVGAPVFSFCLLTPGQRASPFGLAHAGLKACATHEFKTTRRNTGDPGSGTPSPCHRSARRAAPAAHPAGRTLRPGVRGSG